MRTSALRACVGWAAAPHEMQPLACAQSVVRVPSVADFGPPKIEQTIAECDANALCHSGTAPLAVRARAKSVRADEVRRGKMLVSLVTQRKHACRSTQNAKGPRGLSVKRVTQVPAEHADGARLRDGACWRRPPLGACSSRSTVSIRRRRCLRKHRPVSSAP